MSTQRLIVFQPNGQALYPDPTRAPRLGEKGTASLGQPAIIDMSDISNADAAAPLMLVVQKQCDLGRWHNVGQVEIPCWDDTRKGAS